VEVEDTGEGIPSLVRPRIFEPFFTTKPTGRGTGLGLSICYGIVEEHRGRIEVDAQPGGGSVFRVFLPTMPPGTDA
jgi:signal transduction histidine kinase